MKRPVPLPPRLRAGTRLVLQRALLTGVVRDGTMSAAVLTLFLTGGALLLRLAGKDGLVVALAPACVQGALLLWLVIVTGAAIAAWRQARCRAPALWDRAVALPQTMVTFDQLARRQHRGAALDPWETAFLDAAAADTPLPSWRSLAPDLPYRSVPASIALAVALIATGLVLGVPAHDPAPSRATAEPDPAGAALIIEESARLLPPDSALAHDLRDLGAAIRSGADLDTRRTQLARATAEARRLRANERERLAQRLRAARQLEDVPALAPIAQWLAEGGETPDLAALPELSEAARRALRTSAEALRPHDPGLARWLERRAADAGLDTAFEPPPDASGLARHEAVVEMLRAAEWKLAAASRDPATAEGGSDAPAAAGDGARPGFDEPPAAAEPAIVIEEGLLLGSGSRLEALPVTIRTVEPDPEWLAPITRPAVESHWLDVVRRYRALRAERQERESR